MADKLRIGILGLTHDHVWGNLKDLQASPLGMIAAAADPNQPLLDRVKAEYGCNQVYTSYEDMLDQADLDAVYVYCDNYTAVEVTGMAAQNGLHLMVEKPMASDLEGADYMLAFARTAGVQLMVNWPNYWSPALQRALAMATGGEIGHLHGVRYRAAHAGPKEIGCSTYFYNWLYDPDLNGAGALMDYCCYGAALARYLLGQPSRVTGVAGRLEKDYITVEDNAILVMEWSRAMAISEGSWTQIGHLSSYGTTIYGREGTLVVQGNKLLRADGEHADGIPVETPPLPANRRNATAYFLSCLQDGKPVEGLVSAEVGRDAQEILEAGIISANQHEAVSLPIPVVWV